MYTTYKKHLLESCDSIEINSNTITHNAKDAITFIFYNDKMYHLTNSTTHYNIISFYRDLFSDKKMLTDVVKIINSNPEDYKEPITEELLMMYIKSQLDVVDDKHYINLFQKYDYYKYNQIVVKWFYENSYSGRLWKKHKVLAYWKNPETLNIFNNNLKLIESKIKVKFDNKWRFDVFSDDNLEEKLAEYEDLDIEKYESYSGTYYLIPFNDLDLIYDDIDTSKIDSVEILRHLNTATKNPVPYGFGSKNPKKKSLEYKQLLYQESCDAFELDGIRRWYEYDALAFIYYKNEYYYSNNNKETHINIIENNSKLYNDDGFLNYVTNEIKTKYGDEIENSEIIKHIEIRNIIKNSDYEFKDDIEYDVYKIFIDMYDIGFIMSNYYRDNSISGRLWKDSKVISFWKYPENYKQLKNVLNIISNENNIVFDDNWLLDFYIDNDDDFDVFNENNIKTYSTKEYNYYALIPFNKLDVIYDDLDSSGVDENSFKRHLNTATKNPVPYGFGSKNPKKKSLEYRQLLYQESCDAVDIDTNYDKIRWTDNDNITFIYYNNRYYSINEYPSTHYKLISNNKDLYENDIMLDTIINDIEVKYNIDVEKIQLINYISNKPTNREDLTRVKPLPLYKYNIETRVMKYYRDNAISGRFWKNNKVISFWKYPNNYKQLKNILDTISNKNNIVFDDEWFLDFYVNNDVDLTMFKNNEVKTYKTLDNVIYALIPFNKLNIIYDDLDSDGVDENSFKRHLNTATKNPVPYGFGSKNPNKKSLEYRQTIYQEKHDIRNRRK